MILTLDRIAGSSEDIERMRDSGGGIEVRPVPSSPTTKGMSLVLEKTELCNNGGGRKQHTGRVRSQPEQTTVVDHDTLENDADADVNVGAESND
ncbi:hypothetical protein D9757_010239 [Collybiopsis confluens]|uniref:Uncharacterized protein n=1 Tax=Collybiopsis confluens TaxID=2823264 RepID=A0A8H5HAX8_9AGAR|nr:hypothetical protein D9757_010239 [Collybiopsis confluens]